MKTTEASALHWVVRAGRLKGQGWYLDTWRNDGVLLWDPDRRMATCWTFREDAVNRCASAQSDGYGTCRVVRVRVTRKARS